MLLATVICQLIVATVASPYHKYPFVFLLDVGNEELEKTNTEQIRVSIPGGSLAVRYPAVADGDFITHVRVSSIDFGADLKASILDGGPGYKYVVLVFLSKVGVNCDTVITLQTLPSNQVPSNSSPGSIASWSGNSMSQTADESDINTSAEDMSDDSKDNIKTNKNEADLKQQSSNVNNYAQIANDDDENDDNSDEIKDELDENEDDNEQNTNDVVSVSTKDEDDENNEASDEIQKQDSASNDVNDENNEDDNGDNYHAERLQGYISKYNSNLLDSKALNEESLDEDARMYIQDSIDDAQGYSPSGEDPVELDQMFNDEEIHNDSDKYKDSNNNNYDSEYQSAVA